MTFSETLRQRLRTARLALACHRHGGYRVDLSISMGYSTSAHRVMGYVIGDNAVVHRPDGTSLKLLLPAAKKVDACGILFALRNRLFNTTEEGGRRWNLVSVTGYRNRRGNFMTSDGPNFQLPPITNPPRNQGKPFSFYD